MQEMNEPHDNTRLGIYVGRGASHSWTWFVDVLERAGLFNLCFLDEHHVRVGRLEHLHVLLVAGGDTVDLAEGLGEAGAGRLADFISEGGCYIGSCAGAYLMLRSSKEQVNRFNYVTVKIRNHVNEWPSMRGAARTYARYRCEDIFHPVRDEVVVRPQGIGPFVGDEDMVVPLFGGPVMIPNGDASTLATYSGFTRKTMFLVDQGLAGKMVLNNSAAVRKFHGNGSIYLFGPHFEHPHYPAANRIITDIVRSAARNGNEEVRRPASALDHRCARSLDKLLKQVKGEISNARIVAIALQRYPLSWPIGVKTYEPLKILHFLEVVWKRTPSLFENRTGHDYGCLEGILEQTRIVTHLLRSIKTEVDDGVDALHLAVQLFPELKKMTARFLEYHFQGKRTGS